MVRIFKKSMPKITALLIAVMMILSLLPLSGLVSASTETYPEAVTITAKDADGAVSGATVSYTIHSDSTDGDIVAGTDKDISSGEIELISKEFVLAHFTEHPGDTLKLNATIEANGHEAYEIKDAPISVGDENFDATLLKVMNATDVIALPAASLTYNGSDLTLMTINAVKDDKVTYEVDGSKAEKTVTEESEAIQITGKTAKDYEIKVSIQRDGYADFVYPVPDLTDPENPVTTVTVTINKADAPTFSFNMPDTCTFNYVNNTFVCNCTDETYTDGKTEFSFEILDCTKINDLPIATIENGIVTYNNVGFVTIKATASRGDNYKQDTSEHTFTVNIVHAADFNAEINVVAANTDKDYESDGILYANGEGVIISAEGWQIMDSESDPLEGTWSDSLSIIGEGDYANLQVRFKKNNGDITDLQTVTKHFVIDKTAPTLQATNKDENKYGVEFTIENDDALSKVINFLSFGLFCNTKLKVTVVDPIDPTENSRPVSGVKSIELYTKENGDNDYVSVDLDEGSNNEFTLPIDFKGTVYVKITDNVGNTTDPIIQVNATNSNMKDSAGFIMVEENKPTITIDKEPSSFKVDESKDFLKDSFDIEFSITDKQTDPNKNVSGINTATVTVNGITVYSINNNASDEKSNDASVTEYTKQMISVNVDDKKISVNVDDKTIKEVELKDKWNDGKLEFAFDAIDNAGNPAETINRTYYVDKTSPTISYSIRKSDNSNNSTIALEPCDSIADYGYYFKEEAIVTVTATDPKGDNESVSGVDKIKICAIDNEGNLFTVEEDNDKYKLVKIEGNDINQINEYTVNNHSLDENPKNFEFYITSDFKGQLFAFATDKVGNNPTNSNFAYLDKNNDPIPEIVQDGETIRGIEGLKGYTRPNGSILETPEHHNSETEDGGNHISISPVSAFFGTQNNAYSFKYNGDATADFTLSYNNNDESGNQKLVELNNGSVSFDVSVVDTYAGIKSVNVSIYRENKNITNKDFQVNATINNVNKEGDEIGGWKIKTTDKNLVTEIHRTITIESSDYNYNDLTLLVELTDRADNKSYDYYTFGIDTTIPTIKVTYDNNSADSEKYFKKLHQGDKATRTATISIAERNFDPEKVLFFVTKNGKDVSYSAIKWTDKYNSDNEFEPIHETTVDFIDDGDYTFNVECTDLADNKNHGNVGEYKEIDFGDSVAPQDFVVDNTLPIIDITYDNNSAQNGNYYKAERTATIKITEHNFDYKRFELTIKSASETTFPDPVGWTHSGDNHYATIAFTADSLYKFDVEFMDKAGNKIKDYPTQEFTVDKTNPTLTISGIVDESANADSGNIGFVMTAIDTNLDAFTPVITAIRYSDGKFETITINPGVTSDVAKGRQYSVANIDTDGIYMIRCTVTDKAGNAFTEVILDDPTGKKVVKQRSGNDVLLTFSVNRNGSVFYVDGYTEKTINKYYVQGVTESIRIYEINPDEIVKDAITINGKTIKRGTDYSVSLDKGEGSWYKYTYSINKSVFNNEGEYNIVVSSTDKAENQAYSDVKKLAVKFVVDKTAPVVTVAGIKTDGRYRTDKQIVKVLPSDDGGLLKKLIIRTVDEDGKVIKELINLEGDALLEAVEKGEISFELGEGLYQNVQIICEDAAGNITGENAKGEIYENVSISTNAFLIFWANKVARYLAISGVCVVLAGAAAFVFFKKRKA